MPNKKFKSTITEATKEKTQVVREIHRPARKNFKRRKVIVRGLYETFQADLADFQKYSAQNKGFKYILAVIDTFSKYLWTVPIKNKTGKLVCDALRTIFEEKSPKNLQVDDGKEFWNQDVKKLCEKFNVNLYSTFSVIKCSMAERVIRTIKNKLYFEFSLRGNFKWIDILDSITKNYNQSFHRTIHMRPIDVTRNNEQIILNNVYSTPKLYLDNIKFKVNDIVRISKYKGIFSKGFHPNWSTELFKIYKKQITNPVTFLLKDMNNQNIAGSFYEYELQKAKYPDVYLIEKVLRKKGNKVRVKWLGLDNLHNSWIPKQQLL